MEIIRHLRFVSEFKKKKENFKFWKEKRIESKEFYFFIVVFVSVGREFNVIETVPILMILTFKMSMIMVSLVVHYIGYC